MPEKKFSVSEAWTVMLIFFDKVWEKIEVQFSHDYVSEHVFLAMLQLDFECYLEWGQCCEKGVGRSDADTTGVSRIEVQKLSREFVLYFHSVFGFRLPVLLNYFDGGIEVNALWDDAFTAVQDGIRWRREEKSPDFDKYLHGDSVDKSLTPHEGATLTGYFLPLLCEEVCRDRPHIYERIKYFLPYAEGGDSASNEVWKECSIRLRRQPFDGKKFTFEEVFAITVLFVVQHSYMYGYRLYEIVSLLHSMRSRPFLHSAAWQMWQKAVDLLQANGSRVYID